MQNEDSKYINLNNEECNKTVASLSSQKEVINIKPNGLFSAKFGGGLREFNSFIAFLDARDLNNVAQLSYNDHGYIKAASLVPKTINELQAFLAQADNCNVRPINLNFSYLGRHLKNDILLQAIEKCDPVFLNLKGCSEITDSAIAGITAMAHNIVSLNLSQCTSITEMGMEIIATKMHNLSSLNLNGCLVNDASISSIAIMMPNLTSLSIAFCKNITDAGIGNIARLPDMTRLDLNSSRKIIDLFSKPGANLTLSRLDLAFCRITDSSLIKLAHSLPQLKELILFGCNQITDQGLAEVATMPNLISLDVTGCNQITPAALETITCIISSRISAMQQELDNTDGKYDSFANKVAAGNENIAFHGK